MLFSASRRAGTVRDRHEMRRIVMHYQLNGLNASRR
jgi:hypothetical protein